MYRAQVSLCKSRTQVTLSTVKLRKPLCPNHSSRDTLRKSLCGGFLCNVTLRNKLLCANRSARVTRRKHLCVQVTLCTHVSLRGLLRASLFMQVALPKSLLGLRMSLFLHHSAQVTLYKPLRARYTLSLSKSLCAKHFTPGALRSTSRQVASHSVQITPHKPLCYESPDATPSTKSLYASGRSFRASFFAQVTLHKSLFTVCKSLWASHAL